MTEYVKYVWDLSPVVRGYPANFSCTERAHMQAMRMLSKCFHEPPRTLRNLSYFTLIKLISKCQKAQKHVRPWVMLFKKEMLGCKRFRIVKSVKEPRED